MTGNLVYLPDVQSVTEKLKSNMSVQSPRRGLEHAPTGLLLFVSAWATASAGYWSIELAAITPEWTKAVNSLESPAAFGWNGTLATAGLVMIGLSWLLSTLIATASGGVIVKRLQAGGANPSHR